MDVLSLPALAAGTNNIGDVDVLSLPAIPAGTNNIGDVDVLSLPAIPAGTNNIGDVDVLSVVPGTGATALGKAVDSAAGGTDTGVAVLAIRDDALSALTPVEGDYVPLRVSSTGALHVTGGGGGSEFAEDSAHGSGDLGSMALAVRRDADTSLVGTDGDYAPLQVNASGSLKVAITAGAGSGGTAIADDAAFTAGTTSVTPIGALADETAPDSVDEGDCGAVRMSLNRNLYTQIRDVSAERSCTVTAANALKVDGSAVTQPVSGTVTANAGTGPWPVTDNGGSLTVDGTVAVSGTVTVDSELPTAAALADNTANPTVPGVGAFLMAFDGTNWDRVQTGAATGGALKVDGSAVTQPISGTVTANAGTGPFPVSDNGGSLTVDGSVTVSGTATVTGAAAHDSAVSGNPVLIGLEARTTDATAVSTGDAVRAAADTLGKQIVLPYSIPEQFTHGATAAMTGTGDTSVIAAPGASVRLYITSILVTNSHATVGTVVELKDGTTVMFRGYAAALGGGFALAFPTPLRLTANTAFNAANITTGSNTYVSATAYKAP